MTPPVPTAMESLLSSIAPIVTSVFGWVTQVGSAIVANPLLLLTTGFLVLGGAIGIFSRLLSRR